MERIYWIGIFLILVGIILLIVSNFKNIIVGYRTPGSAKSNAHWKYANKLAGKLTISFGVLWALSHYILSNFTDYSLYGYKGLLFMIGGFLIILIIVESGLKKLN